MKINKTFIEGLLIFEPNLFEDDRGYFMEHYNKKVFDEIISVNFVQDNESTSVNGVIRGLHFQMPPHAQAKLIRCVDGVILDVVVDIRKDSKTYGKYFSVQLSSENKKQLFVPMGFAHGFQVLSDKAIVNYKVDNFYNLESESGIIWNDKDLSIPWKKNIKKDLSKKDLELLPFKNLKFYFS